MRKLLRNLSLVAITGLIGATAMGQALSSARGLIVYPNEGQTSAQQAVDENECDEWARQTVGVDPNKPMTGVSTPKPAGQQSTGSGAAKGAVRGAAAGALIGNIAGKDARDFAAAGALAGAAKGASAADSANQAAQRQAQAQAQAEGEARLMSFKKAFAACLQGRKYTVTIL